MHTCALAFVSLLTLVSTTVFGVEKKRRKVDQDEHNEEVASERRSIREKREKEKGVLTFKGRQCDEVQRAGLVSSLCVSKKYCA